MADYDLLFPFLKYYPLSLEYFKKNLNYLNNHMDSKAFLSFISENKKIVWNKELIDYIKNNSPIQSQLCQSILLDSLDSKEAIIELYNTYLNDEYTDEEIQKTITNNRRIKWSSKLISDISELIYWPGLTINPSIEFSDELISKFKDKWHWKSLSGIEKLPWTLELINKHKDKWDWKVLSGNEKLPWSLELINKHKDRWDWESLSINEGLIVTELLLNKFEGSWKNCLIGAKKNKNNFPINIELAEKDFNEYYFNPRGIYQGSIVNRRMSEFHSSYASFSMYKAFCTNVKWTDELINEISNYPGLLSLLSSNPTFPWTENFIDKYIDYWYWSDLSSNTGLPWSIEFIEKHEDRWNWDGIGYNEGIDWSEVLIDKYYNKWDWYFLSMNKVLQTESFIKKYSHKFNYWELVEIDSLWTEELINFFSSNWSSILDKMKANT